MAKLASCFCRFDGLKSYKILTPIGPLKLESCNDGVHSLHLDETTENKVENENQSVCFEKSEITDGVNAPAVQTMEWLKLFFDDPAKTADSRLMPKFCFWPKDLEDSNFTTNVWEKLCSVKSGETLSYSELADICGNPKASRAVGRAMRTNPVILIIPCHRVVTKRSGIGNYASGRSKIKEWLIQHERTGKKCN